MGIMNDLKPFQHGEEGTHYACDIALRERNGCCGCNGHECQKEDTQVISLDYLKELVKLYSQYLDESVEERTHLMTNLDTGKKEKQELRGDFDGFMFWLAKYIDKG